MTSEEWGEFTLEIWLGGGRKEGKGLCLLFVYSQETGFMYEKSRF
jgi:hypothetical protein